MDNNESPAINIRRTTISPPSSNKFGQQKISDIQRIVRMSGLRDPGAGKVSSVSGMARAHMTKTMRGLSRAMMTKRGY